MNKHTKKITSHGIVMYSPEIGPRYVEYQEFGNE